MRKIIKIVAIALCFVCVFAGCGSVEPVDLTIEGTSIAFSSVDDTIEFIQQVKDGTVDYDSYDVPNIVKTCATSAMLEDVTFLTYFESLADSMTLDCVLVGSGSICVSYNLGYDLTDYEVSEEEAYYLNTITLTTYMTDDQDALFQGFYSSGDYIMSADGSYFYGMLDVYGTMSVSKGADNQIFVMYIPVTFSEADMTSAVLGSYTFE